MFTQPFIETQIKAGTGEFPAQMACNAENVSDVIMLCIKTRIARMSCEISLGFVDIM